MKINIKSKIINILKEKMFIIPKSYKEYINNLNTLQAYICYYKLFSVDIKGIEDYFNKKGVIIPKKKVRLYDGDRLIKEGMFSIDELLQLGRFYRIEYIN